MRSAHVSALCARLCTRNLNLYRRRNLNLSAYLCASRWAECALISVPTLDANDYEYRFTWELEGIRVILDRFHEGRGELTCEITIDQTSGGRLHGPAKLNLTSERTLTILGNRLVKRVEVDWDGLFTQLTAMAIRQYREGSPLVDLACVSPGEAPRYLLPPFIDQHGVSVIVADGGTGKSLTMLAMSLAVATCEPIFGDYSNIQGPVVYLDWEADEETHAERLQAICRGYGIDVPKGVIHYQRMVASLHESIATLRKKVADVGAVMIATDSIGMARGGAPESAEETIRLFTALRSFNLPVGAVDHISKETKKGDLSAGADPIGSVYTRNSARLVWSMEGAQYEGKDETVILFKNTKSNFGKKEPTRAYRYVFEEAPGGRLSSVRIESVDWKETTEFSGRVPVADRILKELREGKMSTHDIAERVGISENQARARLNELRSARRVMKLGGEWALEYLEPV